MRQTKDNSGAMTSALVSPFMRQQVRWALSRHRANAKMGVPAILNDIIRVVGDEVVDELTSQDIYNFLDNGRKTRAHKVRIFLSYLQEIAPQYVSSLSYRQFGSMTADFIEAYSNGLNHMPVQSGHDDNSLLKEFDGAMLFSAKKIGNLDDSWMEVGHQYEFLGVDLTIVSFRYPGAGHHLLYHAFTFFIGGARMDEGKMVKSNDERVEKLFTPESFQEAVHCLETLEFDESFPIAGKEYGIIIGGNSLGDHPLEGSYMMFGRGIEPGIQFQSCRIRRLDNPPYNMDVIMSIKPFFSHSEESSFSNFSRDIVPMFRPDKLIAPYLDEDIHASDKPGTFFIPFENKSLKIFIDGFDWGSV